jgi:hypothetical protein
MSLHDVQEKYEALERENSRLQEALATKGEVVPITNAYWLAVNIANQDTQFDGPFCPLLRPEEAASSPSLHRAQSHLAGNDI